MYSAIKIISTKFKNVTYITDRLKTKTKTKKKEEKIFFNGI